MGVLDFLSGGTPYNPQPVNLDPDTSRLIDENAQRAENYKPQSVQSEANTFMPSGTQGPGNVAMSGALQNKYQQLAGQDLEQLNRQQNYVGQIRKSQMLEQSAHMAYARQQVANQNYARMIQAYNNQVAARAQVISSVLGLAGMGAGFALGGPGGAMVGAGAAKAVGPTSRDNQNSASGGYSSNDSALA